MREFEGRCLICQFEGKVRNINLYVIGSEGLTICHDCEMMLVNFARGMLSLANRNRKVDFLSKKDKLTKTLD